MITVRNNKRIKATKERRGNNSTFEGKKNESPRSTENAAPPRFPRGTANPNPLFAFLSRQISSSLGPWQVLWRRNVLTRNDAQQSLEAPERE